MTDPARRFSDDIIFDLREMVEKIYKILSGDGTPANPGVVVRLDRLEQSEIYRQKKSERAWQGRLAVWGAIGTLIVERVIHYLR